MASTGPMDEGGEDTELPRGRMDVYGAAAAGVADGSGFIDRFRYSAITTTFIKLAVYCQSLI
jgi:hypothetical protein